LLQNEEIRLIGIKIEERLWSKKLVKITIFTRK